MTSVVKELDVTDVIGHFGPWQRRIFFMCMQRGFFTAWHTLIIPLLAPKAMFQCRDDVVISQVNDVGANAAARNGSGDVNDAYHVYNSSASVNHCFRTDVVNNVSVACSSWLYETSNYKSTIITEWDLVCDRAWLVSISQTTYMLSMMVNVFIFGLVSDRVGRRPVLLVGAILFALGAAAVPFSPSFIWFNIFRVILAAGAAALQNTAYCNLMECIGIEYRMRVGIAYAYGWTVGLMCLPALAYFITDWRYLQGAVALPTLSLLLYFCFMPESPRWLLTQRKDEDARVVLGKALKVNGLKVDDMDVTLKGLRLKIDKDDRKDTPGFLDLMKTPQLRKNSFVMFYAFFVVSFLYYTLSLGITDLGGNLYLNFFLLSVIELPCYPLALLSTRFLSRRNTTSLFFAVSGLFCLLTIAAPNSNNGSSPWLLITLSTLGKMLVSSSFMLSIIMSGESFPTVLRTLGVAGCWVFARIGSAIAPFSSDLGRVTVPYAPAVLSGILAVTGGGLILLLPNSMQDTNLADTVKEAKEISKLRTRPDTKKGVVNEACEGDDVKVQESY